MPAIRPDAAWRPAYISSMGLGYGILEVGWRAQASGGGMPTSKQAHEECEDRGSKGCQNPSSHDPADVDATINSDDRILRRGWGQWYSRSILDPF